MGKHRKNPNRRPRRKGSGGYGNPPDDHKFKPGQSGNPNGRPRKRKTVYEQVDGMMTEMVTVTINGRQRRIPCQEVGLRAIRNAFMKGDLKAASFLFRVRDQYRDSEATVIDAADISPQDYALWRDYVRRSDESTGTSDSAPGQEGDAEGPDGPGTDAGTGNTEAADE